MIRVDILDGDLLVVALSPETVNGGIVIVERQLAVKHLAMKNGSVLFVLANDDSPEFDITLYTH